MSPGRYAYSDDPRPAVREVTARYRQRFGIDINYIGERAMRRAACLIDVLQRAGRDPDVGLPFQTSMENLRDWRDMFGGSAADDHTHPITTPPISRSCRW